MIKHINAVADHLYMSPLAYYALPSVVGPLLKFRQIPYEDVIVRFAADEFPVSILVPGKNHTQKIDLLNSLIATWIVAREKVQFSRKWKHVKAHKGEERLKGAHAHKKTIRRDQCDVANRKVGPRISCSQVYSS